MKITQLLRNKMGLSQENMAQYLKVTLSQLALYETNRRELPADAYAKLTEMLLFFEQKEASVEEELLKKRELNVQETLQAHAKELEYQQLKGQRVLDKIMKKQQQNDQLYRFAQWEHNNDKEQKTLLMQLAATATQKDTIAQQIKLTLKLESIKSQLVYIDALQKSN